MATILEETTRGDEQLEDLERLWKLEPGPKRRSWRVRPAPLRDAEIAVRPILIGWITVLALAWIFEPAPDPNAQPPIYWSIGDAVFWLAALAFVATALFKDRRPACTCALLMGLASVPVAIGCRTSGHHAGNFWLIELGVAGVFTLYPLAALLRVERR